MNTSNTKTKLLIGLSLLTAGLGDANAIAIMARPVFIARPAPVMARPPAPAARAPIPHEQTPITSPAHPMYVPIFMAPHNAQSAAKCEEKEKKAGKCK